MRTWTWAERRARNERVARNNEVPVAAMRGIRRATADHEHEVESIEFRPRAVGVGSWVICRVSDGSAWVIGPRGGASRV